jgi:hypothetical protein
VKPFRNWWGVKQRASQPGVGRALKTPPEGVAEHSQFGHQKKGVERRPHEYLGSYTEAERRGWLAEGRGPAFFRGVGVSNSATDACSRTGVSTYGEHSILDEGIIRGVAEATDLLESGL